MNNDSAAVLAANNAFYRAFEKKDLEAMDKVWSQGTASLCIHPGRACLKGWESIRDTWEQIFENTDYLEINAELISTQLSGDLACTIVLENILQVSGKQRLEAQSMGTNIFERLGQQWHLIHHHGSPIMSR